MRGISNSEISKSFKLLKSMKTTKTPIIMLQMTQRWSCHSNLANPVQIVSTPPTRNNWASITVFWQAGHADPLDGWQVRPESVPWMVVSLLRKSYIVRSRGFHLGNVSFKLMLYEYVGSVCCVDFASHDLVCG